MSFTTKSVQTQTLGEYLVSCRHHSVLSLAEVGRRARIQPKFILALEEGRYHDLPASVYVKGFLRSLGGVYRISSQELIEQFSAERAIVENTQSKRLGLGMRIVAPRFVWSVHKTAILSILLLVLFATAYLYFQVNSLNAAPTLEVFSPEKDMSTDSALITVKGKVEPGASVYLNNQPITSDASGNFQEDLSLAPGNNQLTIRAVNKFHKETIVGRSILVAEKQIAGSFSSASTTPASARSPVELEIRIGTTPAKVKIISDGEVVYSGTLPPHATQKVQAREKVILSTENAGSTKVVLNGKDLGYLGKPGEAIQNLEFTKYVDH